MFLLDSLGHEGKEDVNNLPLHTFVKHIFEQVLECLDSTCTEKVNLDFQPVRLSEQHNVDDCGIYVMKYMESWRPNTDFPDLTLENINDFRLGYICDWVRHTDNGVREQVLKDANLWAKLG